MHPRLPIDPPALEAFCLRHHVAKLSLFGSSLRDDFHAGSDLDFLVEFGDAATPTLFSIAAMEEELRCLLVTERRVDLRTPNDLSRYFRDDVVREAVPQYEAA